MSVKTDLWPDEKIIQDVTKHGAETFIRPESNEIKWPGFIYLFVVYVTTLFQ